MGERRIIVKVFAGRYRGGGKRERGRVLDEFVAATGYNRSYASWLLRWHGRRVRVGDRLIVVGDATRKVRRRRPRVYGPEVERVLKKLWALLDYASGKRLAPAVPALLAALERHGELEVSAQVRCKLTRISAATMDRLLAGERRKLALKGRARTKPGTLLKHQIPIRTFAEWDDAGPGFAELDLVAHDGGVARGEYVQTLDVTDVATGWTELAAIPTRAEVWVTAALKEVRARLPFPLLGIDSDNGSEFINKNLVRYCVAAKITFTRSRPYRKNDNCFVEQKNWSVVRRFVGHGRLEGEGAARALEELYAVLRLYLNFFVPSMKLVAKIRDGSHVTKRYDEAKTPYQRVLTSRDVSKAIKAALRRHYRTLNPAALLRRIRTLQQRLLHLEGAATQAAWTAPAVDGAGAAAIPLSRDRTAPWKTPAGFPTPPTASATTRRNHRRARVDFL